MIQVPAIGETKATDATGAGDLFASGFLYGVVKGLSLEECCKVGTCSGGSVIRSLGGEVTSENWQWMYKQMQINGLPMPALVFVLSYILLIFTFVLILIILTFIIHFLLLV